MSVALLLFKRDNILGREIIHYKWKVD